MHESPDGQRVGRWKRHIPEVIDKIATCGILPRRALGFLREVFGVPTMRVAIADYVLVELYVHLRNPVVMAHPMSAAAARDLVTSYWKIPNVMRIENATIMDDVWVMAGGKEFARRRIFDARLALTLHRNGVTRFATANVKDFEGCGFEQVWNPLADG